MLSWEDLALNLGGRVKSVLIVALAAFLVAQQGYRAGETGLQEGIPASGFGWAGAVYGLKEDVTENPIDAYFDGLEGNHRGPAAEVSYANIYLDSWEKELMRAYGILEDVFEKESPYGDGYIEAAERLFAEFAQAQGWLEAYIGGAIPDGGTLGDNTPESENTAETGGLSARKAYGKAELTRWLTLRVYGLLAGNPAGQDSGWDGEFGFDKNEAEEALRGCGLY